MKICVAYNSIEMILFFFILFTPKFFVRVEWTILPFYIHCCIFSVSLSLCSAFLIFFSLKANTTFNLINLIALRLRYAYSLKYGHFFSFWIRFFASLSLFLSVSFCIPLNCKAKKLIKRKINTQASRHYSCCWLSHETV